MGGVPAIAYDSDIGFKYGALVNLYHYGDGSNYPNYDHSLYMEWSRQTAQKMIYIDNEMTVDMDLIKVTWDEKTVKLGDLGLNPGKFKFTWDTVDKKVTLNNGMQDLGPTLSYEDEDRKLSVSPTNLQDDYSKTMTLKWFEEQNGNIYLSTVHIHVLTAY